MSSGWGISLLVPFRANPGDPGYHERVRNFEWIKAYWEEQLPLAELIHGHDESVPYSKTRAVNDAARRATGDIFVILDADAYLHPEVIEKSAHEIRVARREGRKLWYIPYRRFYRLDDDISRMITWSDPGDPLRLPDPPPRRYVESVQTYSGQSDFRAHWYGALIQVMPREAFEECGGMDERFAGWGAEDVAFMRTVDALYAPHKSLARSVCHLYHPRLGKDVTDRKWAGQESANSNWPLSKRYLEAKGDPAKMRALVNEYKEADSGTERGAGRLVRSEGKRNGVEPDPKGRSDDGGGGGSGGVERGGYQRPHLREFDYRIWEPAITLNGTELTYRDKEPDDHAGATGIAGRHNDEPDGLAGQPCVVPQAARNSANSSPEVVPLHWIYAAEPSGEALPDSVGAGSTGGARPVGRVKAFFRQLGDGFTWLWAWYVTPVLQVFGYGKRTENSPGDDAT